MFTARRQNLPLATAVSPDTFPRLSAIAAFSVFELDLDAIRDQLTPEAARVILALKSSLKAQFRYEDIATRWREGQLTDTEQLELDQIAKLNTLVGLPKVRAQGVLHPVK